MDPSLDICLPPMLVRLGDVGVEAALPKAALLAAASLESVEADLGIELGSGCFPVGDPLSDIVDVVESGSQVCRKTQLGEFRIKWTASVQRSFRVEISDVVYHHVGSGKRRSA
ncbi:hypothetical protein BaRGS_00023709 [Batillaria attramentaria]|uniref:Uncharacterized protein n=1 Tax=Batillaria attramentaria TaxID=370345 RepID=A0ABD0KD83_9CAEN